MQIDCPSARTQPTSLIRRLCSILEGSPALHASAAFLISFLYIEARQSMQARLSPTIASWRPLICRLKTIPTDVVRPSTSQHSPYCPIHDMGATPKWETTGNRTCSLIKAESTRMIGGRHRPEHRNLTCQRPAVMKTFLATSQSEPL